MYVLKIMKYFKLLQKKYFWIKKGVERINDKTLLFILYYKLACEKMLSHQKRWHDLLTMWKLINWKHIIWYSKYKKNKNYFLQTKHQFDTYNYTTKQLFKKTVNTVIYYCNILH